MIYSTDSEQNVLGGMILDGLNRDKVLTAFESLQEADFFHHEHRAIFAQLVQMYENQITPDAVALVERLPNYKAYILQLIENTVGVSNIKHYTDIVLSKAKERRLQDALQRSMNAIQSNAPHDQKIDQIEKNLSHLDESPAQDQGHTITEILKSHIDELQRRAVDGSPLGYYTGFPELDEETGGIKKGDLVVLGGRPSTGKTVLGMKITENFAKKLGVKSVVITMEMPKEKLTERFICSLGRVDNRFLKDITNMPWEKFNASAVRASKLPVIIKEMTRPRINQVKAYARAMKRKDKLDCLVIDHLHLMGFTQQNPVEGISEITAELKGLALELNVPILLLAQVNRDGDEYPKVRNLKGSGSIEQDADTIVLIHRDKNNADLGDSKAVLLLEKNRDGEAGIGIVVESNMQYFSIDPLGTTQEEIY